MRYIKITALFAVVLLILTACGQSGALYIPEPEPVETSPSETGTTIPVQVPAKTSTTTTEGGQ